MINWLYKFKYTRRGIEHLMKYVVIISAVIYILQYFTGDFLYSLLVFDAASILRGQVWRLVTFVFLTPSSNVLFTAITFYFYYIIGETLEQQWGSFAFTVYYFMNVAVCAVVALLTGGTFFGADYINLSMFLAYGFSYPDNIVMLFMVIPVKMKYLAWLYVGIEILWILNATSLSGLLIPLSGLIVFVIFFWPDLVKYLFKGMPNIARKPAKTKKTAHLHAIHKCEVCGRTEDDDPDLQFRFCSRCVGYHEYCMEHLYNHEHKTQ